MSCLLHFHSTSSPKLNRCAVFNGSGPFAERDQRTAERLLKSWQIQVDKRQRTNQHPELSHLSGSDAERLDDVHWALSCQESDFAWSSRGGYGLSRLLPLLDYSKLRKRPVLGFSDVTALQWALYRRGWSHCIHCPNLHSLSQLEHRPTLKAIRDVLLGRAAQPWQVRDWVSGEFEGPMVGGNINVLTGLCGTEDQFCGAGQVVFLEEVHEIPYRLDHNLTQMLRSGCFSGVRGIVLGQFVDCSNPRLIQAVLRDRLTTLGVPVVANAPLGHGRIFRPFVQGIYVKYSPAANS
jgi:muramoyltetrapeptide carboxypeptidase